MGKERRISSSTLPQHTPHFASLSPCGGRRLSRTLIASERTPRLIAFAAANKSTSSLGSPFDRSSPFRPNGFDRHRRMAKLAIDIFATSSTGIKGVANLHAIALPVCREEWVSLLPPLVAVGSSLARMAFPKMILHGSQLVKSRQGRKSCRAPRAVPRTLVCWEPVCRFEGERR